MRNLMRPKDRPSTQEMRPTWHSYLRLDLLKVTRFVGAPSTRDLWKMSGAASSAMATGG